MRRPQIKPSAFIALQNAMAASFFALLLAADLLRRLVNAHPDSELMWRLSMLANRTVMPVLRYGEQYAPTPDRLTAALLAGILLPLLAWLTRYWLLTAVAGHVMLAALIIMTLTMLRGGNLELPLSHIPQAILAGRVGAGAFILFFLSLFMLVMCIADHLAFLRFMRDLWRRRKKARNG